VTRLDTRLLRRFLKRAGERLRGEWVLIGGTLLPALGIEHRVTTDIELVGLGAGERRQGLALMAVAEELGLPVESVNPAGAHFLAKVPYSKRDLVPLHEGGSAVIYRPGATLYLLLKIRRLTESDEFERTRR